MLLSARRVACRLHLLPRIEISFELGAVEEVFRVWLIGPLRFACLVREYGRTQLHAVTTNVRGVWAIEGWAFDQKTDALGLFVAERTARARCRRPSGLVQLPSRSAPNPTESALFPADMSRHQFLQGFRFDVANALRRDAELSRHPTERFKHRIGDTILLPDYCGRGPQASSSQPAQVRDRRPRSGSRARRARPVHR